MSLYESIELPDSIEPILAVRAWNIHREAQRYFLASCFQYNIIWPFENKLSAICLNDDPWLMSGIKHSAPLQDCDCGIYALKKSPTHDELIPWEDKSVVGLVYLWGKVLEGTKGYRAQYSKPAALLKDDRNTLITTLAESYSIPVIEDLNFFPHQAS